MGKCTVVDTMITPVKGINTRSAALQGSHPTKPSAKRLKLSLPLSSLVTYLHSYLPLSPRRRGLSSSNQQPLSRSSRTREYQSCKYSQLIALLFNKPQDASIAQEAGSSAAPLRSRDRGRGPPTSTPAEATLLRAELESSTGISRCLSDFCCVCVFITEALLLLAGGFRPWPVAAQLSSGHQRLRASGHLIDALGVHQCLLTGLSPHCSSLLLPHLI